MSIIGNEYYLVNDWFDTKTQHIYVRIGFAPSSLLFGVDITSWRLWTIHIPFFHLCIHWLKRAKGDEEYW